MQKIAAILCFLLTLLSIHAQELTIKGMQATNDLSASQYKRADINGTPCGLVKVRLAKASATFEGNVISPVDYKTGEYWVYMTKGSKELHIKLPDFLPVEVHFADYSIKGIQPLTTYTLTLVMPQAASPEFGNNIETITVNGVSFNMVRVVGGTFKMGATLEQGSDTESNEKPAHQVTLSTYSIGETEVTQALWHAVMGSNPANIKGELRPVERVSWEDCQIFIQKLNQLTGRQFRLPTEAEWEYAARGGNKSQYYKYSGSNNIDNVAWYSSKQDVSFNQLLDLGPSVVKTKKPNELGIYDMTGNVWEWCQDWYGEYSSSSVTNPIGPSSGNLRVYRGGGWYNDAWDCRVSIRHSYTPSDSMSHLGLRLAF